MFENGLILTGNEAELLNRARSEVKTKAYEESEVSLDDTQASMRSSRVSELRREKDRRKEGVTHILDP